jgi:hypothetical protein
MRGLRLGVPTLNDSGRPSGIRYELRIGQYFLVTIQQAATPETQFSLYQAWVIIPGNQNRRASDLPVNQAGSDKGKGEKDELGQALDIMGHVR